LCKWLGPWPDHIGPSQDLDKNWENVTIYSKELIFLKLSRVYSCQSIRRFLSINKGWISTLSQTMPLKILYMRKFVIAAHFRKWSGQQPKTIINSLWKMCFLEFDFDKFFKAMKNSFKLLSLPFYILRLNFKFFLLMANYFYYFFISNSNYFS